MFMVPGRFMMRHTPPFVVKMEKNVGLHLRVRGIRCRAWRRPSAMILRYGEINTGIPPGKPVYRLCQDNLPVTVSFSVSP
jgi:hypothetical protein